MGSRMFMTIYMTSYNRVDVWTKVLKGRTKLFYFVSLWAIKTNLSLWLASPSLRLSSHPTTWRPRGRHNHNKLWRQPNPSTCHRLPAARLPSDPKRNRLKQKAIRVKIFNDYCSHNTYSDEAARINFFSCNPCFAVHSVQQLRWTCGLKIQNNL